MDQLTGKVALITGGGSGIGKATALLFAREGAAVAVVDIDDACGRSVAADITADGGKAVFVHGDVSQMGDCECAVQETLKELGRIDILFNNAGLIWRKNAIETAEEEWDRVISVNLKSVFLMCKVVLPYMIQAGGGSIINTSSGWGLVGGRNAASYCASKGGVINLTRAMAIDHGEQNVRINCICPGDTDTPMLRNEAQQLGQTDEYFLTDAANRPLKRIGKPEEIAQAVLFLASDASSYVTGSALIVDGGGLAG